MTNNQIFYSVDKNITAETLAALYDDAGLKRPTNDLSRMEAFIQHADIIVLGREGDKVVGIARTITDFRYCAYLSDLAVLKSYQRKGIGKQLVEETKKALGPEVMLLLLSVPDAINYYPKIGFEKADNAFIIQRSE